MANMNIITKAAANGYVIDVTFYPERENNTAQNWDDYDRNTRQRSYIAKDKAEMKEIVANLLDAD